MAITEREYECLKKARDEGNILLLNYSEMSCAIGLEQKEYLEDIKPDEQFIELQITEKGRKAMDEYFEFSEKNRPGFDFKPEDFLSNW